MSIFCLHQRLQRHIEVPAFHSLQMHNCKDRGDCSVSPITLVVCNHRSNVQTSTAHSDSLLLFRNTAQYGGRRPGDVHDLLCAGPGPLRGPILLHRGEIWRGWPPARAWSGCTHMHNPHLKYPLVLIPHLTLICIWCSQIQKNQLLREFVFLLMSMEFEY